MIVKELVAKLGLDVDELGFERAEAVLHKLHLGYAAFGTAALGALALGAAGLAKATADAARSASKLAQTTGTDLETAQQFSFAADMAGVDVDTLATALRKLARGGVKDVREGMLQLADRFHGMPDSASARAEKVRIAIEKFGRSGAAMVPLLNKGRAGIVDLMREATELGLVFNEDDVLAGKEFRQALHEIEAQFKGIGYSIGRSVLPYVNAFLKGLAHLIGDIRKGAPWVHGIALAFKVLAFTLGGVVLAALAANIASVLTAISWYVALGVAATIAAVKAAAAWLAAAAPAILLVAAFTALLLILDDVRGYLAGEDSLIGALGPKWTAFLDRILKVDGDTPWWVAMLKDGITQLRAMWALATDLEGTFNSLFGIVSGKRLSDVFADVNQNSVFKGLGNGGVGFQGGAASPEYAGAQALAGARGAVQVHAPVTIQIAPSASATPGAIADAAAKRIDEHHLAVLRHTAASIP